jgi:RNA polymerase sigma-B factor
VSVRSKFLMTVEEFPRPLPSASPEHSPHNEQENGVGEHIDSASPEDEPRLGLAPPDVLRFAPGRPDEATLTEQFRRLRGPAQEVRGGDRESLRDHLVLVHAPLVEHCARSFSASGEPLEDLVQEGTIGLIKAVDRFDPDKGVRFSTYACHLISGEMRHYLRDLGKLIHEPGWHAQLRAQVTRSSEQLTQRLGRVPRPEEIATSLDIQPQIVRKVLESNNLLSVASLDVESDDADGESTAPVGNVSTRGYDETDSADLPLAMRVENRVVLAHALPQLRDLEQRAVRMFYFDECSKTEIARQLGISVNYAAYLVKRGVEHLRRIIEADPQIAPVAAHGGVSRVLSAADAGLAQQRVVSLKRLPQWIDQVLRPGERVVKATTTNTSAAPLKPLALSLLQIRNWDEATGHLGRDVQESARAAAYALAQRCCRKADKVVEISGGDFPGLNLLALLPNTGEPGRKVGERWLRTCDSRTIFPANPTLIDALLSEYSFAYAPEHGQTSRELLAALHSQLV